MSSDQPRDSHTTAKPTYVGIFLTRLNLWFTDKDERRTFGGSFRLPWGRYMSVRMAKEVGILP